LSDATAGVRAWRALTSLQLTIACLALLMVLVVACTLAQVSLGTLGAVNLYMRSFAVWWKVPGTEWSIAVLPGGALVGVVLIVNLVAAQARRLERSWRKAGLWIAHAGLVLLLAGEFVTSALQVEAQLPVEVGQTRNYVESPREVELALVDVTDPSHDDAYAVPDSLLSQGGRIEIPGTPVALVVKSFLRNAELSRRGPGDPPALATAGVGASVAARELPPVTADDAANRTAVYVEPWAGGRSYGTWLASSELGAPQSFTHEGRTYALAMRARRDYLPYSVTLKEFRHDVYPGTDIPKNFSSKVRIGAPEGGPGREVLIYMNNPLRYEGLTYYQAGFDGEHTTILQVVRNPSWLVPYVSCGAIALGLAVQFLIHLAGFARGRRA